MSSVVLDVQLDVDLLIQEVKKRPCLYEKNHLRYGDLQYKRAAWDEVTAALFIDFWDSYDNEEKVAKCDLVLKRWKNLRACFTRECKRQKDPKWIYGVAYKRRKYIYYNELSFLKSEYDTEETTENSKMENTTLTVNDKFGEPIPISVPKTNAKVNIIESPSNSVNARPTTTTNCVNTTRSTSSVNGKSSTNSDHSYSSPDLDITNITSNSDNSLTNSVTTPSMNSVTTPSMNCVTTPSMNSVTTPSMNSVTTPSMNCVTTPSVNSVTTPSMNSVTTPSMNCVTTPSMNSVSKASSNSVLINSNDTDSTSFALSLVPMLNMLSMDDKVECQIKILSAILPFMKKCRDDGQTEDGRKGKTATPTRKTYGKNRMEDIISVEIKSEGESDEDVCV